jgi:hypothetical protein
MSREEDFLLTIDDVASRLKKPARWVREKLVKTGLLKTIKLGGNSDRITLEAYRNFVRAGVTGCRHATPSGRWNTATAGRN